MTKQRRWTVEEIDYLKQWYGKKTALEIAQHVGCKSQRVIYKAKCLGLKSNLTKQPKNTLRNLEKRDVKLVGEMIGANTKTDFKCPFCNDIFQTTPTKVASGHTKSCGCVAIGKRKGTEHVSSTYFTSIKQGALQRSIEFDISIEYIDDLLVQQDFKCKLSGLPITAGYADCRHKGYTASLDRIDSSVGYVPNNVQWVHKDINLAKQSLSNQEFIKLCKDVYLWSSQ